MIKTEHLSKRYHSLVAVDDVSFQVAPGEVLGFLGPNGAGKTTTMRMLAGFITPTAGKASICGHDIVTEPMAAKASLGYLPEGAPTYGEMSVRNFLEFIADLRHLEGDQRRKRLDYVIGRLQLSRVLDQTIDTLSKGFRRRSPRPRTARPGLPDPLACSIARHRRRRSSSCRRPRRLVRC